VEALVVWRHWLCGGITDSQTAKKFLPTLAVGYSDPRVTVHVRDAFELIAEVSKSGDKKYDLIVCDSTDPVGFASALFEGMSGCDCRLIEFSYLLFLFLDAILSIFFFSRQCNR
jgi:hypothetical protein